MSMHATRGQKLYIDNDFKRYKSVLIFRKPSKFFMIHVRKDYSNPVRTSEDKLHQFFDEFWPSGIVFVVWLQKYSISFALFYPKSYLASFLSNSIAGVLAMVQFDIF